MLINGTSNTGVGLKANGRSSSAASFRVDHEVDADEWDGLAASLHGSVFHTTTWARYQCQSFPGVEPVFGRWFGKDGKPLAIAVGSIRRAPWPLDRALSRVSFASPPATTESPPPFEQLVQWARGQGAAELDLGSLDAADRSWGARSFTQPIDWVEFLATPGKEDELWRRMRKGTRSAIRRAQRLGVSVELAGAERADDFAALYANTLNRLRQRKGVLLELDESRRAALPELIRSRATRLYLAVLEGQPVAGCLFGTAGDRAYYMLNGSSSLGLEVGATPLALLQALTDLSRSGHSVLSLGGVSAAATDPGSIDHGLYAFKLGLGAEPVPCTAGSLRLSYWRAALSRAAPLVHAKGKA